MPMPHEERKRRFKAAAALAGYTSLEEAAKALLSVSYFHLGEVFAGRREGSEELKQNYAVLVEKPYEEVWGERPTSAIQVA